MFALGASKSQTTFFQVKSGDTTRNGLRAPDSRDAVTEIPVNIISLDEYVREKNIKRVDVIKLDVEGGEIDVLRGGANVFRDLRPLLICEVLDATTLAWGYDACQIIQAVQDFGYEWFDLNSDGSLEPHAERLSYPRVKNYLAVPREKRELVTQRCAP
jgi:hypothetical protein